MSTVLLVDDDIEFRRLVSGALSARGHAVVEAGSGKAGVAAMAEHAPGVVIIDGLLPDGDGLRWIPKLREVQSEVPIVFVSSFYRDMASFKRLNDELRVALVAHKPIEPTTFVTQIDALLGTAPTEASAPETAAQVDELEAQLAVWRAEYSAMLPQLTADLRAALERTYAAPADESAWKDARERAHKIRGTAGSHGLMPVSEAAAVIEDALVALKGLPHDKAQPFWQRVQHGLNQLPKQAAIAPPPLPPTRTMPSDVVVVVGGDASDARQLVTLGRAHNYAVVHVAELTELLDRAKARVPAVVVINMKGRSHDLLSQVTLALRRLPSAENVSIVVIDSPDAPLSEVQAVHAGASLRLPAGTKPTVIASAIARVLFERPQQTRVLVVDDDPMFGKLVLDVLAPRGITARHIAEPLKLFDMLEELNPDLVLLDMMMPEVTGLELCKQIRKSEKWRHVSVLFITAQGTVEQRIAAFRAGADDYLVKPVVNEELLARVEVRVERAKLMRDRADRDTLTGLTLRRAFLEQLEMRMAETRRYKRPLSLALVDVDHFKKVNDTYGHLIGDRVLATMGQLLSTRLRTEDLRGRWGGEELVIALPNTPAPMARQVLTRLLEELAAIPFTTDDGRTFNVTFSAGVSACPEDGDAIDTLLRAADTRLYEAKQAGRKRVH